MLYICRGKTPFRVVYGLQSLFHSPNKYPYSIRYINMLIYL